MKYIIVKNGLVDNFTLSNNLPATSSDEIVLEASKYNVQELKTPYDAENDTFLTKFKGELIGSGETYTTNPSASINLKYTTPVNTILESNIRVDNASISNFVINDLGATFDLFFNEEILSSSAEEIIKVNVDESIRSVDGYTTTVPSLEFKYTGSL